MDRTVRRFNHWAETRRSRVGRKLADGINWPVRAIWHVWRNRNYLTGHKLLNMGLVQIELMLRRRRVMGMPYIVKIEPTNICNSSCQLCPTGMGYQGRTKGKMSYEDFCRVIDQVKKYAYIADLSNWGDPLIVPDIHRMIRYAHDAGLWTYISSNLHAFNPDNDHAEQLVHSGLDMLNCSLHAVDQKSYEVYQPGKQLNPVLKKIEVIVETKRRMKSATPRIQLFFVVTKFNEHQIDPFRRLADRMDCEAVFIPASLNLRLVGRGKHLEDMNWSAEKQREQCVRIMEHWLPTDEQWVAPWYREDQAYIVDTDGNGRKKYSCSWPWQAIAINWDGAISVCCGDYDPCWQMGNIFETPLKTIWNNPAYQAVRQSFRSPVEGSLGQPCKQCPGVLP